MKKSEKIEIRISYDEKEKLARLAESEGRSVSELVRDLAKKYAQLNMPSKKRRMSYLAMAGLILCGLGTGVGATLSLTGDKTHAVSTQYTVHGVIKDTGFSFNLNDQIGDRFVADLDKAGSLYQIHVVIKSGGKRPVAAFDVCKIEANECLTDVTADLEMGQNSDGHVWQSQTENGDNLFLVLQPVFIS